MYERLRIDVKVERRFNLSYIACILFTRVKITREWKSTLTQIIVLKLTTREKVIFSFHGILSEILYATE